MNEFFTQFKTIARTLRLSQSEKQAMRVDLYNYLERNPIGGFVAPAAVSKSVPSNFFFFSPRFVVPVALLVVLGLGSGSAFAAQGALPGDILYPIKINVNEAVQTALATSPEAKAEVNAELATTRLEEAETLASGGKLDATTTAELAINFTAHAQAVQVNTDSLQSNNPGAAAQLGADFDSTLSAHGAILAQIGDDSSSTETMQDSNSLAITAQHEVDRGNRGTGGNTNTGGVVAIETATSVTVPAVATPSHPASNTNARIRTFAAAMPQSDASSAPATSSASSTGLAKGKGKSNTSGSNGGSTQDAQIATMLGVQASSSLADVAGDFAALKPSLDGATSAQINNQIVVIQVLYDNASTSLAAGDASAARNGFSGVLRLSIRLDAYLEAGKKFNIKLLSGLLSNSDGNDNGKGGSDDQDASSSVNLPLHL